MYVYGWEDDHRRIQFKHIQQYLENPTIVLQKVGRILEKVGFLNNMVRYVHFIINCMHELYKTEIYKNTNTSVN